MSERIPTAHRPMRQLYIAIAQLLENDQYLTMTEQNYVSYVMTETDGAVDPEVVAQSYRFLIQEAKLEPLSSVGDKG